MLPIYVMHDSGLDKKEARAVWEAVTKEVPRLLPGVSITYFGSKPWTSVTEPYSSADWYIKETPRILGNYGEQQLDGDYLLDLIKNEPWQHANPHIDIFITSEDMTVFDGGSRLNFVFGVAEGRITVQSVARYRELDNYDRNLAIKAVIHHELGHVFGMAADLRRPHTEYKLGPHCTNYGCVMRQGMSVPEWVEHAREAYTYGIYCSECLADAKHFIH